MTDEQLEVIHMRLDFMSMALAVLARSLSPREASHAVQVIGERVIEQLGRDPVSESVEEAVAADFAPITAALQQRCNRPDRGRRRCRRRYRMICRVKRKNGVFGCAWPAFARLPAPRCSE